MSANAKLKLAANEANAALDAAQGQALMETSVIAAEWDAAVAAQVLAALVLEATGKQQDHDDDNVKTAATAAAAADAGQLAETEAALAAAMAERDELRTALAIRSRRDSRDRVSADGREGPGGGGAAVQSPAGRERADGGSGVREGAGGCFKGVLSSWRGKSPYSALQQDEDEYFGGMGG